MTTITITINTNATNWLECEKVGPIGSADEIQKEKALLEKLVPLIREMRQVANRDQFPDEHQSAKV